MSESARQHANKIREALEELDVGPYTCPHCNSVEAPWADSGTAEALRDAAFASLAALVQEAEQAEEQAEGLAQALSDLVEWNEEDVVVSLGLRLNRAAAALNSYDAVLEASRV